jgi:hypothetical protein
MADTSLGLFTSLIEGVTGEPWFQPNNMLTIANDAYCEIANQGAPSTTISLSSPVSGGEIPAGQEITDILVRFSCSRDVEVGSLMWPQLVQIANGTENTIATDVGTVQANRDYPGDLAYWGITKVQALALANGTEPMNISAVQGGTGQNTGILVYYVQVQFTYQPSTLINLPTIF